MTCLKAAEKMGHKCKPKGWSRVGGPYCSQSGPAPMAAMLPEARGGQAKEACTLSACACCCDSKSQSMSAEIACVGMNVAGVRSVNAVPRACPREATQ